MSGAALCRIRGAAKFSLYLGGKYSSARAVIRYATMTCEPESFRARARHFSHCAIEIVYGVDSIFIARRFYSGTVLQPSFLSKISREVPQRIL